MDDILSPSPGGWAERWQGQEEGGSLVFGPPKKQGRKSRMKQQGLKKGMGHNLGPRWYKEKNMIINFSLGWMT